MKNRNEKLIAIFDSLRSENKGDMRCNGASCDECPFRYRYGCYIAKESTFFDLDKAIEIIDNYKLPIKEYTIGELDCLAVGTIIEVSNNKKVWKERCFATMYKGMLYVTNPDIKFLENFAYARPIQEVKDDVNDN